MNEEEKSTTMELAEETLDHLHAADSSLRKLEAFFIAQLGSNSPSVAALRAMYRQTSEVSARCAKMFSVVTELGLQENDIPAFSSSDKSPTMTKLEQTPNPFTQK